MNCIGSFFLVAVDPMGYLEITSTALQIIKGPIKCRCWSYGTFYLFPLTPWDPVGTPLDPLGPTRPTPRPLGPWIGIKDQPADLSGPICPCSKRFAHLQAWPTSPEQLGAVRGQASCWTLLLGHWSPPARWSPRERFFSNKGTTFFHQNNVFFSPT